MEPNFEIKDVAIYLRKSRGELNDERDDLAKHEAELIDLTRIYNWRFTIYKEIGSSASIDDRPEMVLLLQDVENDLFDAVLVMDYDRLSRGDLEDQGRIRRILKNTDTKVITPTKVYDFNNEEAELINDIEGVFSRHEYRMIKKRLNRGKKRGAKSGNWTNGKPPYPYVYNPLTKTLDVDPIRLPFYELIKKRFFEGIPCYRISWELNSMGVEPPGKPRGRKDGSTSTPAWSENAVYRILTSEVHLGYVIYGKTSGSGHKNKRTAPLTEKPEEEWIKERGNHSVLKSEAEHAEIIATLSRRKLVSTTARRMAYPLSGLVKCGMCGYTLAFTFKTSNKKVSLKTCQHHDPIGNRCRNSGVGADIIYSLLDHYIADYEERLRGVEVAVDTDTDLKMLIEAKENEIVQLKNGFDRITDLYIMGTLNKEQIKVKTDDLTAQIQRKQSELKELLATLGHVEGLTNEQRLQRINEFKQVWKAESADPEQVNGLARSFIDRISYTRDGNDIGIDVRFI
ncbi:recombinase family protein [Paenibacillus cremeus]|nr:recombinase family protein [Paenibacillus cremeus]